MTVDELRAELEQINAGLNSSGFGAIEEGFFDKLDLLSAAAGELGLREGVHLINNLKAVIHAIQDNKSQYESGTIRLTALEFYLTKLSGSESIEDL